MRAANPKYSTAASRVNPYQKVAGGGFYLPPRCAALNPAPNHLRGMQRAERSSAQSFKHKTRIIRCGITGRTDEPCWEAREG